MRRVILLAAIGICFAATLNQGFYYDDPVQLLDATGVLHDPASAFGSGSFGRFRPLRLLSLAGVTSVFGIESPVPFHVLALGLHAVNALLLFGLLRRLMTSSAISLEPAQAKTCALAGTLLFAFHAAGSEAVTYLSAIGMLYVTGGFFTAGLALLPPADNRSRPLPARLAVFLVGLAVAALGGEYWLATIPAMICFALWPGGDGRLRYRFAAMISGTIIAAAMAYLVFQHHSIASGTATQFHTSFRDIFGQHAAIVSQTYFPADLIDEPVGVSLILFFLLAALCLPACRRLFFSPGMLLLGLACWSMAAAFSVNGLVNGGRFIYPLAGLAGAWTFGLIFAARGDAVRSSIMPSGRVVFTAVLLMCVTHMAFLNKRVADESPRGESMRTLADTVRSAQREYPIHRVEVFFLNHDVEHAGVYLNLLDILDAPQIYHEPPTEPLAGPGLRILAEHDRRTGYTLTLIRKPSP